MPTETLQNAGKVQLAVLAVLAVLANPAHAQTDDTTPFYVGGSMGVSHVSNIYRTSDTPNSDTVVSAGVLGGIDTRLGRQHLTLDGSLQNNRYSTNTELNYRSHSLRAALDWATVGNLSGLLSAKTDRSMADFNASTLVKQIYKKNIETDDEYQAVARLGVATRYTLQAGWTQRSRNFSAQEYDRLAFSQNAGSLGIYLTPGGNVRLGLVARRTKGKNPRYPNGTYTFDPDTLQLVAVTAVNDYTRNDADFTADWSVGGHSRLNARISRSRTRNSMSSQLSDFSGTTGAVGWNWQPTSKFQLNIQYARDTGQETVIHTTDLNRVYTSWTLSSSYQLTGKLSTSAKVSSNRSNRAGEASIAETFDNTRTYNLGLTWAFSRGLSLTCQYDHLSRDNSVTAYTYTASSYGCTGQAIFF